MPHGIPPQKKLCLVAVDWQQPSRVEYIHSSVRLIESVADVTNTAQAPDNIVYFYIDYVY